MNKSRITTPNTMVWIFTEALAGIRYRDLYFKRVFFTSVLLFLSSFFLCLC